GQARAAAEREVLGQGDRAAGSSGGSPREAAHPAIRPPGRRVKSLDAPSPSFPGEGAAGNDADVAQTGRRTGFRQRRVGVRIPPSAPRATTEAGDNSLYKLPQRDGGRTAGRVMVTRAALASVAQVEEHRVWMATAPSELYRYQSIAVS